MLNVLRTSEIEFLDLCASLADEGDLNLGARDLFQGTIDASALWMSGPYCTFLVFTMPNSFLFLYEINLSGIKLHESDVMSLHHLPRLGQLWLQGTAIRNEAYVHVL